MSPHNRRSERPRYNGKPVGGKPRADLHVHTNLSTGYFPPELVAKILAHQNIRVYAIMDHETDEGTAIAQKAVELNGFPANVLQPGGFELSAKASHAGENRKLHLLVYFPTAETAGEIKAKIRKASETRRSRIIQTVGELGEKGFDVSRINKNAVHGIRTTEHGIAKDVWAASAENRRLAQTIAKGKGLRNPENPADFARLFIHADSGEPRGSEREITRFSADAFDYISVVKKMGGHVVLAHPRLGKAYVPTELIERLINAGLDGIEVFHPNHSAEEVKRLAEIAQKHGMVATFGSDFHMQWPTQFKRLLDRQGQEKAITDMRKLVGRHDAPHGARALAYRFWDAMRNL